MGNKFNRFLSLLLALVMVIGLMPVGHAHAEEETFLRITEKVAEVEENASYVICLHGTMQGLTNQQGKQDWGTHTLATAACGEYAAENAVWTLETAEGGYKLKNVNGYLEISRNTANVSESGHNMELTYHGDDGWSIKSLASGEYGNNLGGSGSIGGWENHDTKFDLYKLVEVSAEEADPFGKLRGLWKKVSVDTETIYDAKEGKFEYAWDNNPGTHWHSNWQGASDKLNGSNTFTGIIDFGQAYVIDQFSFIPRQDGNNSGLITQASLYVRETEAAEWRAVAEHATFDANTGKKDINFDDQAVRYVKFVAEQSNDGWVAVSEFEIARISVDEHTHSYTGEVTTAATCTEAGEMTYTCECGDSYTNVIPATGHRNTVITPAVLPTLNAPGKTEEVYCNDCQQIVSASEEVAQLTVKNAQPLMDNWNSGVVALSDCEYTLTGTEGSYSLCHGGHYYVKPSANGNGIPQQNEPFTGVILAFQNNGKVRIGGNGYIHVHRAGASDTREGHPYWDKCGNSHGDASNGTDELYLLKKNADSTNANIPGYEQVTSVEAGESYLIAFANARGEWFVMYPSTETVSIAKVVDDAVTHTHEYTTTTQAATCAADGLKTDTCQCGHVHTEVIPATGEHEWVDATCTAPKTCSACGATEGEALDHSYVPVVTDPTCTTGGYTTYTCSACGDTYVADEVDALGHTASEAVTENENAADCTEAGSYDSVVYCSVCKAEISRETVTVPALGHKDEDQNFECDVCGEDLCTEHVEEIIKGYAATCTEPGMTDGKKCAICGEILAAQEVIEALGHQYKGVVTAPDCVTGGCTTYTCELCGDVYVDDVVAPLGHTEEIIPAVPATCTTTGLTEGKVCTVCGEILVAQEVVPALDHTAGEVVKDNEIHPTCTSEGSYELVVSCSVCFVELSRQTVTVSALGHVEEILPAVAPTCTATGLTEGKKCTRCGETLVAQEVVDALGHTYETLVAAPTCAVDGCITYICSACGDSYTEVIPATGEHIYDNAYDTDCNVCGADREVQFSSEKIPGESILGKGSSVDISEPAYDKSVGNAFDGDYNTFWATDPDRGLSEAYLIADLGGKYLINQVAYTKRIYNGSYDCTGNLLDYIIEVSTDGQTWNQVADGETEGGTTVITFDAVEASHVRLTATRSYHWKESERNKVMTAAELEIFKLVCTEHTPAAEAVRENEKAPSCTEAGSYDSVVYCSVCCAELSRETIAVDALGHNYEAVVTDPDCVSGGYTTYTCSVCGDTYVADETPALGHTAGEVVKENNVLPTCTAEGSYELVVSCSVCGEELSREHITVPALDHIEEILPAVAPTCTATGLTEGKKCTRCGETLVAQEVVDALGHNYEAVVTDPTCTEGGYTTYTCDLCGDSYVADETSALGHSYEAVVTDPTCEAGGYTTYTCAVCGDSYVVDETSALGHSYENGFCTGCGGYEAPELNADGFYEIGNAGQLYWFAAQVNNGANNINAILTDNIEVNENLMEKITIAEDGTATVNEGETIREWVPIGGSLKYYYSGTFDGNGKTVKGLYRNVSANYVGLIGNLKGSGKVQNVTVADSYFCGGNNVGGVVGLNDVSTVSNCYNTGTVSGSYYVGGVVGYCNTGATVSNCHNTGTVSGSQNVGGVAGWNGGSMTECCNAGTVSGSNNVGGVLGSCYDGGTVSNCYNTGTVSGSNNVGGVVGSCYDGGTVSNCYNTGSVSGNIYVGGVVAYCYTDSTVSNCYNTRSVSGSYYVGGVVGVNSGTVTNCYNTGSVSCSKSKYGGVVADNSGTVTNCFYLDTCGAAGEGTAKTEAQFASGEVAWLLNGSTDEGELVWKQNIGTDAIPGFEGEIVSYSSKTGAYYNKGNHEHQYEAVVTDPTCTEPGYTTYTCSVCDDSYVADETPALGHTASEAVVTDPTCTEPGYTTCTCSVCGDSYVADETPALGHSYEAVVTDPTCTTGGYTTYTCSVCGDSYVADETSALGHSYEKGFCTGCGGYEAPELNADGFYEIGNAGQLYWFAAQVNNGANNINAILTDNIEVNENLMEKITIAEDGTATVNEGETIREWVPIGGSLKYYYSGTFDGNGKTVKGLYRNVSANYVGLIGYLEGSGKVQNVTVADSYFYGGEYVGGVVGYSCAGSTVSNCHNTGTVSGSQNVGGVAGYNGGSMTECCNAGTVSGRSYVGGVAGWNADSTLSNCYNTGTVSGSIYYVGGVVGWNDDGTLSNCYNTGSVSAKAFYGGVVGLNYDTVSNCYNTGTVSDGSFNGGVVAANFGTVTNCFYLDTCGAAGEGTAKTEAQFASGEVAWLLNGSTDEGELVWKQNIGTDAIPGFEGEIVSYSSKTGAYYNKGNHEHQYEAVVTDPTCTEPGYTTYTCSDCGDSYVADETSALGHTASEAVKENEKAPTCTETGSYDTVVYCSVCSAEMSRETITVETLDHEYEAVVTDPTCTTDGYTTYTCTVCGDSYVADETPALGHSYEAVVTDPTCTTDGYTTYTCTVCGDSYVADETPALGHSYEAVVTDPTCTTGGYTTYTCDLCGDIYVGDETAALGHTASEAVMENEKAPTCTETGSYDTVVYCSVCSAEMSRETITVEALDHEYEAVVTDPTCTEPGYTTYTCSVCGDSYVADETPALGHSYEAVVTDPTCTEPGYTTYTCSVCGDSYIADETSALGHTASEAVMENEKAPTCTETGSYDTVVYCSVCFAEMSRETITVEALGHEYEAVVTDPTCTTGGYTTYTCTVCGDSYVADETSALGHDWHGRDCSRCDAKFANPFVDVPEDEFYVDPVLWALQEGLTTGTTENTFSPYKNATRGEVVTFLWRAMGEPKAEIANPFNDVTEGDFYYEAVLWAYEQGITTGVEEDRFAPQDECTRAQTVTFLWRTMGKPEAQSEATFADVAPDSYYATAVAWAVENGITFGMGGGYFGVNSTCIRAQIVTFLYRTFA